MRPSAGTGQLAKSVKPKELKLHKLPDEFWDDAKISRQRKPEPAVVPGSPGPTDKASNKAAKDRNTRPSSLSTNEGEPGGMVPQNYGAGNQATIYHYSDLQVDTELMNDYPFRPTGYLEYQASDGTWNWCTASLISKSILVTAGHCVHKGGGGSTAGFIRQGSFYPGRNGTNNPYSFASVAQVFTTTGWFRTGGIDQGYDVGLAVLNKRNGTTNEIGASTGYYGFCTGNCLQDYWHLAQLGYPRNYYSGNYMTEGQHLERSNTRDFLFGSGMQGGSSGGPHIANLGSISDSSSNPGQYPTRNVVFAVTSWGYTDQTLKVQGASSLTGPNNSNNFKTMFNQACNKARSLHGSGSCTLLP